MSKAAAWRVPDPDRPPDQFWTDFSKFVNASMIFDDTDHYWQTLIRWADVLMNRYNNHVVNLMVMDYLDGQSRRSIENERKKDEFNTTSMDETATG